MKLNRGSGQLKQICDADSIRLVVFLHADRNELKDYMYNWQVGKIMS